jgi:peptidoglycan/xylan/chitin deacetylase (PgdA/CDA1 family)
MAIIVGGVFYFTVFVVPVVAGGRSVNVLTGTTVGDMVAKGLIRGRRGDIVAVRTRSVITTGGGGEAVVLVNGKPARPGQQLTHGDVLTMRTGADVVEPLHTRTETIGPSIAYEGVGPVETVVSPGTFGYRRVQYGFLSHQIVSSTVATEPVPRIILRTTPSTGKKTIALTFDDGPWTGSTAAILKILQANGARATFFQIGRQARAHPAWTRMLVKAGMLVGNHSESHPARTSKLPAATISWQITKAESDITAATGGIKPLYFRPPGGTIVRSMRPVLAKLGMRLVEWDIDTLDWTSPPPASIVNRVLKRARDGAVVLMHDGGGNRMATVTALPIILKALKAEGYSFVTVDQLRSIPVRMGGM